MTSFLIGYPDIPLQATAFTTSATEDASFPATNLITGRRGSYFQFNAVQTSYWIKADLGASVTASMQYFFLARAKLWKLAGVTQCILQSSPNDSAWTNRIGTSAAFSTRTYTGPRSEDLLFTSTFNDDAANYSASAFRYWRITGVNTSSKLPLSKWYCGNWFDFGREPLYPAEQSRTGEKNQREAAYVFDVTWVGITDTLATSFREKIERYKDISPVVLYDSADCVINGHKTLHAWVREVEIFPDVYNQNTVRVRFEEAL